MKQNERTIRKKMILQMMGEDVENVQTMNDVHEYLITVCPHKGRQVVIGTTRGLLNDLVREGHIKNNGLYYTFIE